MDPLIGMNYVYEIDSYLKSYEEKVSSENAQAVIENFNDEWEGVTNFSINGKDYSSEYEKALITFSIGVSYSKPITQKSLDRLKKKINNIEIQYPKSHKAILLCKLYFNLGVTYSKLININNEKALKAIKRSEYYHMASVPKYSYDTEAYKFVECSKYLYESLSNETLNLTSPSLFNDPFDSPIIEFYNSDDKVSQLLRSAYKDCIKVACFSRNMKLPYYNWYGEVVFDDKKRQNDVPEYLNELMWSHYADSHKGICIKYHFPYSLTSFGMDQFGVISHFSDIQYSDSDMDHFSKNNQGFTYHQAFFLKGKQWSYENELRYLCFDPNGQEGHKQIDVKNCIEAVFFGIRCSKEDENAVRNILKNKKFILHGNGDKKDVIKDIEFYNLEIDKSHYGQLKIKE